jgi:hypothetical protein
VIRIQGAKDSSERDEDEKDWVLRTELTTTEAEGPLHLRLKARRV